jgi:nicotinate-nucleotide adenylyltransferase
MERIGVFGGTFDPVHYGHLRAAEEAAEYLKLDRVLFVPTGNPPHRGRPVAAAAHRLAMLRKALARHPKFSISTLEIRSQAPSYTLSTLRSLRQVYTQASWYLLLGTDQLAEFDRWFGPEEILKLTKIIALTRPGTSQEALGQTCVALSSPSSQSRILPLSVTALDISSSAIRLVLQQGRSARYLLPEAVLRYCAQHGLYTRRTPSRKTS